MTARKTIPTIKNVIITKEDKYRKELMIDWLKERRMLDKTSEAYIRKRKR